MPLSLQESWSLLSGIRIRNLLPLLLSLIFVAVPALGQNVSFGVKLGIPLTSILKTQGEIGYLPFKAETRRFAVGPVLDIRFPHGLAVEAGATYKRFDQYAGQLQLFTEPYQLLYVPYSRVGASWEFPIVAQYRFRGATFRPYLEGGICFNHLTDLLVPFRAFAISIKSLYLSKGIL